LSRVFDSPPVATFSLRHWDIREQRSGFREMEVLPVATRALSATFQGHLSAFNFSRRPLF